MMEHKMLMNFLLHLFNAQEVDKIMQCFELHNVHTGRELVCPNANCNLVGFVVSGILKAEETKSDGKVVIHYFWSEGDFFSEPNSFFNNQSTRFSIVAATPCTLLCTTNEKLVALEEVIPTLNPFKMEIAGKVMYEKSLMQEIAREGDAKNRYFYFLEKHPSLINQLQIRDIARFLNTTPNHLSSIRSGL